MYAIIEEAGGQRKVVQGDEFLTDLIEAGAAEVGKKITFDKVLIVGGADGASAKIGQPYVSGASVSAEITEAVVLGPKLTIQYFQAKKNSRRRTGHRQRFTKVKVTAIKG
jgi:large subunit ribosomal protein L21